MCRFTGAYPGGRRENGAVTCYVRTTYLINSHEHEKWHWRVPEDTERGSKGMYVCHAQHILKLKWIRLVAHFCVSVMHLVVILIFLILHKYTGHPYMFDCLQRCIQPHCFQRFLCLAHSWENRITISNNISLWRELQPQLIEVKICLWSDKKLRYLSSNDWTWDNGYLHFL